MKKNRKKAKGKPNKTLRITWICWTVACLIFGYIIVSTSTSAAVTGDWPRWVYARIYADAVGAAFAIWIIGVIPLLFCPQKMLDEF